jgi:putative Mg2+ transporter-C (MgtC) family protein
LLFELSAWMELGGAGLNMIAALVLGCVIGLERQARNHMAGVRTNGLVALAASGFVVFSTLVVVDSSPTRVAAQVVSGIGFLGAGVIFRDGFTVHGLNTAATLWCAAAVGVMCGIGAFPHAVMLTALVMVLNLGLRPIVFWFDRTFRPGKAAGRGVLLHVVYDVENETEMRRMVMKKLAVAGLGFRRMDQSAVPDGLRLTLELPRDKDGEAVITRIVGMLATEAGLKSVDWELTEDAA